MTSFFELFEILCKWLGGGCDWEVASLTWQLRCHKMPVINLTEFMDSIHGIRVVESVLIASAGSNELEQQPLVPHPSWTFGLLIDTSPNSSDSSLLSFISMTSLSKLAVDDSFAEPASVWSFSRGILKNKS